MDNALVCCKNSNDSEQISPNWLCGVCSAVVSTALASTRDFSCKYLAHHKAGQDCKFYVDSYEPQLGFEDAGC